MMRVAVVVCSAALVIGDATAAWAQDSTRGRLGLTDGWGALWYNTGRAYSEGTGPVWTGRGLTVAASAGVAGRFGRVSYTARPIAFWSENAAYRPSRTVVPSGTRSPWFAEIDLPYRFGTNPYGRLDAGESFVRVDVGRIGVGVSNQAQVWGPARLHPLLMSGNAGGFQHAFLESARGVPIGIGRVSGRWLAGKLSSSGYGPPHEGTTARTLVGAVATFTPRGLDGLELGGGRVFHMYESAVSYDITSLTLPISAILKNRVHFDQDPRRETNQLANAFFRIAPPGAGVELYGEFLRDDHNVDFRDLTAEPDHDAAYTLGLRRMWPVNRSGVSTSLTLERSNGRISHLVRARNQAPMYTHFYIVEGHTQRGLPLGDAALIGGGALTLVMERGGDETRWVGIAGVVQSAQNREGGTWNGTPSGSYTLGLQRRWKRGNEWRSAGAIILPSFGDVRGFDLQIGFRSTITPLR